MDALDDIGAAREGGMVREAALGFTRAIGGLGGLLAGVGSELDSVEEGVSRMGAAGCLGANAAA